MIATRKMKSVEAVRGERTPATKANHLDRLAARAESPHVKNAAVNAKFLDPSSEEAAKVMVRGKAGEHQVRIFC